MSAGRPTPVSTYRLQVRPGFGFDAVAELAPYLADLGVTHAYLSPILAPVAGSEHGYDVLDHTRLNQEAGGREAFDAMVAAVHAAGLRVIVDVVPNHMAVPVPEWGNAPLWEVLRGGEASERAHWFDVDWAVEDGRLLMPFLGGSLEEALAAGELVVAADGGPQGEETVVRYYEHELPVAPGTEGMPLADLVGAQHWRVAHWREGLTDLNYRRFFDVTSLIAIRVEDERVFAESHELLRQLLADGSIDGLRIDHPDGLADPKGYLDRLADLTDGAWVVAEKILEGDEALPSEWACAGTTGYDLLWRLGGIFVDPAGREPLTDFLALVSGVRTTLGETTIRAKREIVDDMLVAEVRRLVRRLHELLPDEPIDGLTRTVSAMLVSMDRYRAYIVPGIPADDEAVRVIADAADRARADLPEDDHATLEAVVDAVLGRRGAVGPPELADLVVRFQQTCGPVMAKGIEDTTFYRWQLLLALNEVGGDPDHFAVAPDELFRFVERTALSHPTTMTTLSTHDTKRSEDVRARLAALSERAHEWQAWVRRAQELARPVRSAELDGATEYLLWQTLVGVWPIDRERLQANAQKAIREAKIRTRWTDVDEAYESAVSAFVDGVLDDPELVAHVESWVAQTAPLVRATTLGQKLLQLVLPGVPDVYQGTELVDLSLVDPDNRRDVDVADRRTRLSRLDAGELPVDLSDEKLLVTSRALRLRRDHPEWFVGEEATWAVAPTTTEHVVAVTRGAADGPEVVAIATRLAGSLGDWDGATVAVPPGTWRDLLTGRELTVEDTLPLADLLRDLPVALLVRNHA